MARLQKTGRCFTIHPLIMNKSRLSSRRRFLRSSVAGLAAGVIGTKSALSQITDSQSLVIDCHAHIYSPDEGKYPPIQNPNRPPQEKGTIQHLKDEMRKAGVRYVTAVQTSSFYRWDNRFTVDSLPFIC